MKTLPSNAVPILIVCCFINPVTAQDPVAAASRSISDLRASALDAIQQGDSAAAISAADAMMESYGDVPRAMRLAGDVYLRTGKVERSVKLFDRYLEDEPQAMRGLWQRGIALYFAGDYRRAAKQFEEHRIVNPNDVENAAWHFLCIAKAESFERAKQMVLPAPGDPRIPMAEVLNMLSTGDTEAVNARVNGLPIASDRRDDAAFYGDFYLGLYADARGDRANALRLLSRAAEDAPHHYMGDVARVYAKHLAK